MGRPRATQAARHQKTRALILRRVDYGEADQVLTLYSEHLGKVSALARAARRSRKRFGGSLEPFHTLSVGLDERSGRELLVLTEASLETPRHHLVTDLDRMDAAGKALSWVKRAAPAREPEPNVWREMTVLLDRLDQPDGIDASLRLAQQGLRLLSAFGWALDLERCIRCGRPCDEGRPAMVDAVRGGLVCRACGGARVRLTGIQRAHLIRAAAGDDAAIESGDANVALSVVEDAVRAHVGHE